MELKSCPFCDTKEVRIIESADKYFYVLCDFCLAQGPYVRAYRYEESSDGAKEAWNHREYRLSDYEKISNNL